MACLCWESLPPKSWQLQGAKLGLCSASFALAWHLASCHWMLESAGWGTGAVSASPARGLWLDCFDSALQLWSPSGVLALLTLVIVPTAYFYSPVASKVVGTTEPRATGQHGRTVASDFKSHSITLSMGPSPGIPRQPPVTSILLRRLSGFVAKRLSSAKRASRAPTPESAPPAPPLPLYAEAPFLTRRSWGGRSGGGNRTPEVTSPSERAYERHARVQLTARLARKAQRLVRQSSNMSSSSAGDTDVLAYRGGSAVDCLAGDATDPDMGEVQQVIPENYLLQFGSMIGQGTADELLARRGAPGPVCSQNEAISGESSLFGCTDRPEQWGAGWEKVVEEHKSGLHCWGWRRYLRKGLYAYKSSTVFEGVSVPEVAAFYMDVEHRSEWDDSSAALLYLPPPNRLDMAPGAVKERAYGQSSFMFARTKFPPPMAQREYVYGRRVWYRPDDGGVYCISKACPHPATPSLSGRMVCVEDYAAGYVIRSAACFSGEAPASEILTVYFEDARVSAGFMNLALRKGMWALVQKSDAGLRCFVRNRGTHLPVRRGLVAAMAPSSTSHSCASSSISLGMGSSSCASSTLASSACSASGETVPLEEVADMAMEVEKQAAAAAAAEAPHYRTSRPHLTPLLYSAYLSTWRQAAAACGALQATLSTLYLALCQLALHMGRLAAQLATALARALLEAQVQLPSRDVVSAVAVACFQGRASGALGSQDRGGTSGRSLCSHPITPTPRQLYAPGAVDLSRPSTGELGAMGLAQPAMRNRANRRGVHKLLGLAVRAVGLPLMHRLLTRKGVKGAQATDPVERLPSCSVESAGAASTSASMSNTGQDDRRGTRVAGSSSVLGPLPRPWESDAERRRPRPRFFL